ncbi:MAG: hypothetical protein PHY93_16500 [Bacteriovorax sp.]|nr:hypothetical protein [Bacteriovorax sp.]
MRFQIITIILSGVICQLAYGQLTQEECTKQDVRDKNPQLKDFFSTPRDQDSIGWCYAFAAADLLSVAAGTPVSSMHASAIYNKSISNNFFWSTIYGINDLFKDRKLKDIYEGGYVDKALNETLDAGNICTEKELPFDSDYNQETYRTIKALEELKQDVQNEISFTDFCTKMSNILPRSPFTNVDLMNLYQAMLGNELNQALEEMMANSCQGIKVKIPDFKTQSIDKPFFSFFNQSKNDYFKKIGEVLADGRPLAISYDVGKVLRRSDSGGGHASVIMARQWRNNKCEYKIRNSWGSICGYYREDIECNRNEGSFWVDEDTFYEMVIDIDYISNK